MATALELCLTHMKDLEERIELLEAALAKLTKQAIQPPAPPPKLQLVRPKPDDDRVAEWGVESGFPELLDSDELDRKNIPATIRMDVRSGLEDIPRVMHRIRMMWFYPECEDMLDKLIIDDRGNRAGFSPEVMEELLFLASISRTVRMHPGFVKPLTTQKGADVWQEQRPSRPGK